MDTVKTRTILDSNVVLDVLFEESEWHGWSIRRLTTDLDNGGIVINPVVFAEASPRFESHAALFRELLQLGVAFEQVPWEAAFAAGKAHAYYRRAGGARERVLPDFLIGAHASVGRFRIMTRDPVRYRTYFPSLDIIAPDSHP